MMARVFQKIAKNHSGSLAKKREGIEIKIVSSHPGNALYAAFPILDLSNKGKCS